MAFQHPYCGGSHETVADARACESKVPAHTAPAIKVATEKQVAFVTSLIQRKDLSGFSGPNTVDAEVREVFESIDWALAERGSVSQLIDRLLALPDRQTVVAEREVLANRLPDISAGYYAIDGTDGRETRFYRVDRPTEGRWAGRTFLKVQSSDDFHPIRDRGEIQRVLLEIALDPKAAGVRYGREIGRCCICNRTLTDDASREAGIGPVCAEKF